jgi:hypothetical protein
MRVSGRLQTQELDLILASSEGDDLIQIVARALNSIKESEETRDLPVLVS